MAEYAWTVTARKTYRCDDERGNRARHDIPAGTQYVRCVAFPDGDINCDTRPWMVRICPDCYTQFGAEMPPPRRRRKRLDPATRAAALAVLMSDDAPKITQPQGGADATR